jgi:hypothetical protein
MAKIFATAVDRPLANLRLVGSQLGEVRFSVKAGNVSKPAPLEVLQ